MLSQRRGGGACRQCGNTIPKRVGDRGRCATDKREDKNPVGGFGSFVKSVVVNFPAERSWTRVSRGLLRPNPLHWQRTEKRRQESSNSRDCFPRIWNRAVTVKWWKACHSMVGWHLMLQRPRVFSTMPTKRAKCGTPEQLWKSVRNRRRKLKGRWRKFSCAMERAIENERHLAS